MSGRRGNVARLLALLFVLSAAGAVDAQTLVAPPSAPITSVGWTVTPAVAVGSLWDSNVALSNARAPVGDLVTAVSSSLGTQYRGRRGKFVFDYRGTYEFYRRLTAFNAPDHRVNLDADHRLTRNITLFARDSFNHSPTTDNPVVEIGEITMRRRTTTFNDLRTGVAITPGPHSVIEVAYGSQWIDLARDEEVAALLRGGYAHRGDVRYQRQMSQRLAFSTLYDFQHAIVGGGEESFDIQRVRGLVEIALSPTLVAVGGTGYAWQLAGSNIEGRSAPVVEARLHYTRNRTLMEIGFVRSYLPSFGFGGTVQNKELRASVHVPFGQRLELNGFLSARDNDPLIESPVDNSLRAVAGQATLTWNMASRLRLEFFASQRIQDSRRAGGRIERGRFGIRFVTHHPMRLR